jgi:hypothetical protein
MPVGDVAYELAPRSYSVAACISRVSTRSGGEANKDREADDHGDEGANVPLLLRKAGEARSFRA